MDEAEILKALKDIADLKSAVKNNLRILRPIFLDRAFVPFSFFFAWVFAALFGGTQYIVDRFGTFGAAPLALRLGIGIVVALLFAAATFYKWRLINRIFKREGRALTVRSVLFDRQVLPLYLTIVWGLVLSMTFAAFAARALGDWWLLLPAFAFFLAFGLALFAVLLNIPEYLFLSGIAAAFGLAFLLLARDRHFLWLAAWCWTQFIGFALVIALSRANRIPRAGAGSQAR